MGEEIASSRFSGRDFAEFTERLREETDLLRQWFEQGRFANEPPVGGFELEAWLVDREARPAPINRRFLESHGDGDVVPELSRFNVELNTPPERLVGNVLGKMFRALDGNWAACNETAAGLDARLAMIGILPTVREQDLTLANMSDLERYRALNEQVFRLRHGKPLRLDIQGRERMQTEHRNVMLEAATTSFQIHMQLGARDAVRHFNAAIILAAPIVAVTANSPFLFGRDLWDETRIALFEQSINTCDEAIPVHCPPQRVTFGGGYVRDSLLEIFEDNLRHFPPLLPVRYEDPVEDMHHLRLHNGTIWRWNRPLIGFSAAGEPHLRIEHRVAPSGPTVRDCIANAALFFGLSHSLAGQEIAPESLLDFDEARRNFYAAARHGLSAELQWLDGSRGSAHVLLLEVLLPRARAGLYKLGLDRDEADAYMNIIEQRVRSGRNGAGWLRGYRARYGCSMEELTAVYLEHQSIGKPVHEWMI
jgi:gamma-glutamyl:cysteine ligase YbdK (ATP-grasp superfamily)